MLSLLAANVFRPWMKGIEPTGDDIEKYEKSDEENKYPDSFPVDKMALALQTRSYLARTKERCNQVLTVNQLHVNKILFRNPFRLVVQAGAADIQ